MLENLKLYFDKYGVSLSRPLKYGTAGFRADASILEPVFYRIGVFAVIRSYMTNNSCIGICTTASHNVVTDNGVKLCDYHGGLLDSEYEDMLAEYINSSKPYEWIVNTCKNLSIDIQNPEVFHYCKVLIGYDTRPSSQPLSQNIYTCLEVLKAQWKQLGVVTTPQLQFAVEQNNLPEISDIIQTNHLLHYFSYFEDIIRHFNLIIKSKRQITHSTVFVDCANGVAALHIEHFQDLLKDLTNVTVILRNKGNMEGDILNFKAGSDYIQMSRLLPYQFYNDEPFQRCCAFDGDADRVIYFEFDEKKKITLLDGDRLAILFLHVLYDLILSSDSDSKTESLSIGIVQTAYANGASTKYIKNKLVPLFDNLKNVHFSVKCVKTGVKYLHSEASKFDIGIYFETNGHGTILHNKEKVKAWINDPENKKLFHFLNLFNKATGDAMMNFVAVELCLLYSGWNHKDWLQLYTDRVSIQDTIPAERKYLDSLKPHYDHEQYLLEPTTLQEEIDNLISLYPKARMFVRPSGTEEKCRIFVEAETEKDCKELMAAAKSLVSIYLGLD